MHATHGYWCGARTVPTRCRHCGDNVFYFSCNCGSKVFFNELGGLWPEHRCLQYLINQYGKEFVERGLAQQMMRPGIPRKYRFDQDYERQVHDRTRRPRQHQIVRRLAPPDAEVEAIGVVRELIAAPDLFKKVGVPDTVVGRALLGPLGRERHCQVTVHVGSLSEDDVDSFTFYAPERILTPLKLHVGAIVMVRLRSHVVPGKIPLWLASHLSHAI